LECRASRKEPHVDETLLRLAPADLDALLREQLGRRLVVAGLTLVPPAPGSVHLTGEPPAELLAGLSTYAELWVRWTHADTPIGAALRQAAQHDADVVLGWLAAPIPSGVPTVAAGSAFVPPNWPLPVIAALIGEADDLNLRDRCVFALAGPDATQALARQAGCDEGFALAVPLARIVGTLAREVLARDEFRRGGSSPPCYL
jgi:hypothetical protein